VDPLESTNLPHYFCGNVMLNVLLDEVLMPKWYLLL